MTQLNFEIGDKLHKQLKHVAKQHNLSLREFTETALSEVAEIGLERLFDAGRQDRLEAADFTFIDLFAGIGGTRLAFEAAGGGCVFSSEWDKFARLTYSANFRDFPKGDITQPEIKAQIPDHDILVGGFPCQPFSLAGVSKKNSLGREHGFKDKTQGTLFFHVAEILEKKQPKMFLLENVKNLKSHNKGDTFRTIEGTLKELGYEVFHEVLDAKPYVPQHRERIFLVGLLKKTFGSKPKFEFPKPPGTKPTLGEILDPKANDKYVLSDHMWQYLQDYAEKHRKKGNGFGFGLVDGDSVARTLSARYHKDGSEILVEMPNGSNPRRLTPRECAGLMGFPKDFKIVVSDTQAYRQFGNSVVVPLVTAIAKTMASAMKARCEN